MTNCLKTLFEKQRRETHIFSELSPDFLASHSLQGFGNKKKRVAYGLAPWLVSMMPYMRECGSIQEQNIVDGSLLLG